MSMVTTLQPSTGYNTTKVKRGYFERRVIPYFLNISETTEASELNVGGYNLEYIFQNRAHKLEEF